MEHFPVIHTNFWDSVIAVPLVLILTQIIKVFLPIPRVFIPTIANIIGLAFSLFVAHRYNFWGAVFMGFFYGNAAVGTYASIKTTLRTYRNPQRYGPRKKTSRKRSAILIKILAIRNEISAIHSKFTAIILRITKFSYPQKSKR